MSDGQIIGEVRPILRDANGRILAGSGGINPAGRPKGSGIPTFSRIARQVAEGQGATLEEAMQSVVESVFRKAAAGDGEAQRMVLARVPDTEAEAEGTGAGGGIVVDVGDGYPVVVRGAAADVLTPTDVAAYTAAVAACCAELAEQAGVDPEAVARDLDEPAARRRVIEAGIRLAFDRQAAAAEREAVARFLE